MRELFWQEWQTCGDIAPMLYHLGRCLANGGLVAIGTRMFRHEPAAPGLTITPEGVEVDHTPRPHTLSSTQWTRANRVLHYLTNIPDLSAVTPDQLRELVNPWYNWRKIGTPDEKSKPGQRELIEPWRNWTLPAHLLTSDVVGLLRTIRAGGFGVLPVLADALEDAGCDDRQVLDHLRQTETPHHSGCWALALLGEFKDYT